MPDEEPPSPSSSAAALATRGPRRIAPTTLRLPGGIKKRVDGDGLLLSWRPMISVGSGAALLAVAGASAAVVWPHPIAWCLLPLAATGVALMALRSSIRVRHGLLASRWAASTDADIAADDVDSISSEAGADRLARVVVTLKNGEQQTLASALPSDAAGAVVAELSTYRGEDGRSR